MFISKIFGKSKEITPIKPTEPLEIHLVNIKNYEENLAKLGRLSEEYITKDLPKFGQRYYQYALNDLEITFAQPKKNQPIFAYINGIIIGEVSPYDNAKIMPYLTAGSKVSYYFGGGNYVTMDFEGKVSKGFYSYYCNITFTP